MRRFRFAVVLLGSALAAAGGAAAPFDVVVDLSQSTLHFELCISGSCDTDSSAVTGTVTVDVDSVTEPTLIWLHDFDLQLADTLSWYISWSFLGSFSASAANVQVTYAEPGTIRGPEPVTAGDFQFHDVPAQPAGTMTYLAVGIPCVALQSAGYLCDDTTPLGAEGPQVADVFAGTISTEGRVVTLATTLDITAPLVPESPSLGTLHVYGTVRGSAFVPFDAGDLNCDGLVNSFDIDPFVLALTDPAGYATAQPGCNRMLADTNHDGVVNSFDIDPFVLLLTGGR
jgi:hypothetical protein